MKRTVLIRTFFQNNKVAAIIVSLLMLASIFVMCWIQGLYDYCMRYVHTLDSYVGDGDLYMQFVMEPDEERTKNLLNEVSAMSGVKHVLYNVDVFFTDGENSYSVKYVPKATLEYVDFESDIKDYARGSDSIECLAAYGVADEGSILSLSTFGDETYTNAKKLNFKVRSVLPENFMYLNFMCSGDALVASEVVNTVDLLDKSEMSEDATAQFYKLFVTGEDFLDFIGPEECHYDLNFIVIYEDDASDREIKNAREFISQYGGFLEISEIIENSKETEITQIKRIILLPELVLGVVTFACCAIILLIMQEKMQEYSIYYLCGYSKRRIILLCYQSLSLIMVIPCAINLLIIIFNEKISDIFGISFGTVIYSVKQILFTIGYLLVMLFITGLMEFVMVGGMSPVTMYRRMTR